MRNHVEASCSDRVHERSYLRTRRHRSLIDLAFAASAALTLAIVPALPALADGVGSGASPVSSPPAAGFHVHQGPDGETDVNVCSYAVSAGTAHCDVHVRSDTKGSGEQPARSGGAAANTLGNNGAYDPSYLQSAYNVASAASANGGGAGQTVAIIDAYDDPHVASDLAYYRSYFGLTSCPAGTISSSSSSCVFEKVNQSGTTSPLPVGNSSWGVEISLDVEMVSAICAKCQILLVEANSASISDLGTAVNEAVKLGANVVSNSYGSNEYGSETTDNTNYYDHPGVAVVASSGDSGYGVEFPAASPDVTAVGGTSLSQLTNTGTRNGSETVWSGAGAGCSSYEPKPSWQKDTGCIHRTVADVSAVADPSTGVWVYDTYGSSGFAIYGGTSVAAPIIGSFYALAGSHLGSSNLLASYPYGSPSSLYAVTSGSDGSCGTYLCNATDSVGGYNGPTGLGTPGGSPSSIAAFTGQPTITTVPGAPTLKAAAPGNASVGLSWSAPSSNGGSSITGYDVYEGTAPGAESATPVNSSLVSGTSYTVSGLANGAAYYFTVEAVNAVGNSLASNELSATPVATTVPGAPTNLGAATTSPKGVLLGWTAPSSNGGSTITSYTLYRSGSSNSETYYVSVRCTSATCSYKDTNTKHGTTYYYEVAAVNAVGTGALSNQASAKAR
ncbi:MAG TPA: fibronectin type III domain-containing protein [Acidimicrobiales bacterium]|nr:fibronectin type III domain-containing protein [Acidimicrobiales bacterium]